MPRPPRAFYPGCYVHTTTRGNNRSPIFLDTSERERFLRLMRASARRHEVTVCGYCLMGNHGHFLARYPQGNVDAFMATMLRPYALWFNRRHGRTGHLFQDRYYSRLITDTDYLHEAGRYIHMNPVEAGLAAQPEDYPWSSYAAHLSGDGGGLVDVSVLREPFILGGRFDVEAFQRFTMERRTAAVSQPPRTAGQRPPQPTTEVASPPPLPPGWLDALAAHFGTDSAELARGGRTSEAAAARGAAMLVVFEELAYSQAQLAVLFGLSGKETVSRSIRQAIAAREHDSRLAEASRGWAEVLRQHC